jgi:uncharacterized membrane protein
MPFKKYIAVILATTIKFFGGQLTGLFIGITWWETAICSVIGMMITVTIVSFLGTGIQRMISKYQTQKPKLFSKRSRFAVRIWQKLGIWGIACFTPLFFTPIGGTLLALSFKVPIPKILFSMFVFAVFWGVTLTYLIFMLAPFIPKEGVWNYLFG